MLGATDWPERDKGRIPVAWHAIGGDEADAVHRLLVSGQPLIGGPAVREFERCFAERVGARHAIATMSGTAALEAAYLAADVAGGEVVTTPLTFSATASAAHRAGANVRFADIDPWSLCLDPHKAQRVVSEATRAVVPVHFAGRAARLDMLEIAGAGPRAVVIEDAAHAVGGSYVGGPLDGQPIGSWPNSLCCFSFGVQKNMTTIEGGMVTTGDDALAAAVRQSINQGMHARGPWRDQRRLGFKGRMTDLTAAIGLVQLARLGEFIEERRAIAGFYTEALGDVADIDVSPWPIDSSTWHIYPIRAKRRRVLVEALWRQGIEVAIHYRSLTLHSYWAGQEETAERGRCGYAETAGEDLVSLPCFPGLAHDELKRVVDAVRTHA